MLKHSSSGWAKHAIKRHNAIHNPPLPSRSAYEALYNLTKAVVDIDGDYTADLIYASDLNGNLWKFDVRDPDPIQWTTPGAPKLFETTTSQPITTRPEVGIHPIDPDVSWSILALANTLNKRTM